MSKKIEYPEDLKEKIKELLPNHAELHNALDTGDVRVGTLLLDTTQKLDGLWSEWAKIFKRCLQKGH